MDQSILHTVKYFEVFSYPPSYSELILFFDSKISKDEVEQRVRKLVQNRKLRRKNGRLALHTRVFEGYELKRKRSVRYFNKVIKFFSWTAQLPSIQYVGVSGSLSMLNMTEKGDVDIFVITTRNSIWQTRFILLVYKYFLKLFYQDLGNKLCFNLFFSENGLELDKNKQNEYIGHEILQLKHIVNKNQTYERFLLKNKWILKVFPNVQISSPRFNSSNNLSKSHFNPIFLEEILKKIQLWWLSRKNMSFDYRGGQLWLIQEDFEKKIISS